MKNSFRENHIIKKRSISSYEKLPPIQIIFKKPSRIKSTNELLKIITSDSLMKPKAQLKDSLSKINDFDISQYKLSPTTYKSEFEQNLMDDCKQKYEKILKQMNEVRSLKFKILYKKIKMKMIFFHKLLERVIKKIFKFLITWLNSLKFQEKAGLFL